MLVVAILGCLCRRLYRIVWSGGSRTRWRKRRLEISTCRSWWPRCIIAVMASPEMPRRSIPFSFIFLGINYYYMLVLLGFFGVYGLGFGGSLFFIAVESLILIWLLCGVMDWNMYFFFFFSLVRKYSNRY